MPTPEPKAGEVRIKIEATTVTAGDAEMRALRFPWYLGLPIRIYVGWPRPKRVTILGQELAGTIVKVGDGVTRFKPGDKVFAATAMPGMGGHAEYVVMAAEPSEGMLALRPAALTAEEAATIPFAAFEALHLLKKAGIAQGEKLLIVGAAGSIGTYAIQIAEAMGAEVSAVDRAAKRATLKEIGVDLVIDAEARSYGQPSAFDVVFDVVGKRTFGRGFSVLRRGGRFASANPRFNLLFRALWRRLARGQRVIVGTSSHSPEALDAINKLIEEGKVKPVIGRRFDLDDIVGAHRYAESAEKVGNVVVNVASAAAS